MVTGLLRRLRNRGGDFQFLDPGPLSDGELWLELAERYPGDRARGCVPAYVFRMRLAGRGDAAGRLVLRIGDGPNLTHYAGHVGYGVEPPFRGRRLAARAVVLALPLALRHGVNPLWITCNPDNAASRRTCELAGGIFVEIVDVPPDHELHKAGEPRKCRYRFDLASA